MRGAKEPSVAVGPVEHPAAGPSALESVRVWAVERRHVLGVWTAMAVWAGSVFATVRSDYLGYRLGRLDLGNMVQAVWSTSQGRPLDVTTGYGDQIVRLAGHVDPILVLLTPLWMVLPSPLTLAAAQIAALALGALPVFWLARRHAGSESVALVLACAYLAYPWLAWSAVDAIHPVTFAVPLLLVCVWALDSDRLAVFAASAILAAATGELLGLTIAALGIWYALARSRRIVGAAISVLAAAWTLVALLVVVPAFAGEESMFYGFYENVGGSPTGVVRTLFTDPAAILSELLAGYVLLYVFLLALPVGGLFLLAPGLAVVALPQLMINALADPVGPVDPRQHYLAAIVPFVIAATVLGVARLGPSRHMRAALVALMLSVLVSMALGPWAWSPGRTPLWYQQHVPPRHVAALDRAVEVVPEGAPVSSTNKAGLRLSARRHVALVPYLGEASWVVVDTHDPAVLDDELPVLAERPEVLARFRQTIEADPQWRRVFAEDGVFVYRRVSG